MHNQSKGMRYARALVLMEKLLAAELYCLYCSLQFGNSIVNWHVRGTLKEAIVLHGYQLCEFAVVMKQFGVFISKTKIPFMDGL